MNNTLDYILSNAVYGANVIISFLIIAILAYVSYSIITHYRYLHLLSPELEIDTDYDSYRTFKKNFHNLIKYSVRKYIKYYKFVIHYIHFYIIKSISFVQLLLNLVYSRLRNNFVEKSIGDKKYVAHFWGNLKEFKKEMDKE